MKRILALLVLAAALLTTWHMRPATGQGSQQPVYDGPAAFLVSYDTQTNLDPNTAQLYQTLASVLNGSLRVPNDRLNYYSAVNSQNDCQILGWEGIVTGVAPNANGYLVTLDVHPYLGSVTDGASAFVVSGDYSEQYQVNNDGSFQYTGFLDPQGLAGQLPAISGF